MESPLNNHNGQNPSFDNNSNMKSFIKQGTMIKSETSNSSGSSASSTSTTKSLLAKFLPTDRVDLLFAQMTPNDDSFITRIFILIYYVAAFYFTITSGFATEKDDLGETSSFLHMFFATIPFKLGFELFITNSGILLTTLQVFTGVIFAIQIIMLILTLLGAWNQKLPKSSIFRHFYRLIILLTFLSTGAIMHLFGTWFHCNFFHIYSAELESNASTYFADTQCFSLALSPFQVITAIMLIFQIFVIFVSTLVFLPLNQTSFFGLYTQMGFFFVILTQFANHLLFLFIPASLQILGYFTSFLISILGITIWILEFPFHSIFQGAIFCSFILFRGSWSFLLGIYSIIWKILMSDLFSFDRQFLQNNQTLMGIIIFLATLLLALITAGIGYAAFCGWYLRLILKFRKLLKSRKQIHDAMMGGDENEENKNGSEKNLVAVQKKNPFAIVKIILFAPIACCLRSIGLRNFANLEFRIGAQLSCTMKNLDGGAFDEIIHEKILDEAKKDDLTLEFAMILLVLTRKKMEKLKMTSVQPNLSDLLMSMIRRLEPRASGVLSKLKFLAVQNYLFSLHDKSAINNEIKNTLAKAQRLEAHFWGLNESFWKLVLDGKQRQDGTTKAKNSLLILIKKIKMKKMQIKELYVYLLGCFPKDPSVLKLFGKYLHHIERNPESQVFFDRARDIEEERLKAKRKKIFLQSKMATKSDDIPDFLDGGKSEAATHDISGMSDTGDTGSEDMYSTTDDEKEKAKQEKVGIANAILRPKSEFIAKAVNFCILAALSLLPAIFVGICFYINYSNTKTVAENTTRIYNTCRLPGDTYYAMISMRFYERANLSDVEKIRLASTFSRLRNDIKQAFFVTNEVGEQKQIWERTLPMTFVTFFPISNFTNWENNLLRYRTNAATTLSSISNSLVNYVNDFLKTSDNKTAEFQQSLGLVPYVDRWSAFLDESFVSLYVNARESSEDYDRLCEDVFEVDHGKAIQYNYITIASFVVIVSVAFPATILFFLVWCLLLMKQKNIMKLFYYLPKDVIGAVYQDAKKKTREQSKGFASNYSIRILFCYWLAVLIFVVAAISAFVVTLLALNNSISTLSSIRDAAGIVYRYLALRFLLGEIANKYTSTYPISTTMTMSDFTAQWLQTRPAFYQHWNSLRFGADYTGLEAKGIDCETVAITVARLLGVFNRIQELTEFIRQNNNTIPDYIRKKIAAEYSILEYSHYTVLDQVLYVFLPALTQSNTTLDMELLAAVAILATPLLLIISFILLRVVGEYEDDNYELLQQFQRVPADTVLGSSAIRNYIFENSLSEVDNFAVTRILGNLCSCNCSIRSLIGCCLCRFGKRRRKVTGPIAANDENFSRFAEEIYQSSPTPVVVCGGNGNVSFISNAAMKCFEFENQTEVLGLHVSKLFSMQSKLIISGFFKNLQKNAGDPLMASRRRESMVKEEKVIGIRKTAKEFPCILSISTIFVRGQISVALFVTDVTTNLQHDALMQEEKQKSEKLLLNILPAAVAKRLSDGEQLICESFPDVTCFFSDIVGFTNMSSKITAWELIKLLNDIVNGFDEIADILAIEKIKTIGDAYFAVSGLHSNNNDHAQKLVLFAIKARSLLGRINRDFLPASMLAIGSTPASIPSETILTQFAQNGNAEGSVPSQAKPSIHIRIGLHTGPVVGGVIGKSKFQYDVWGSTVNMASRMESTGIPGKIQISRQTYERVHDSFKFEERENVYVKGIGECTTYLLDDSKLPQDLAEEYQEFQESIDLKTQLSEGNISGTQESQPGGIKTSRRNSATKPGFLEKRARDE